MSAISDISAYSTKTSSWLLSCLNGSSSSESSTSSTSSSSSDASALDPLGVSAGVSSIASFISASESLSDDDKAELKEILKEAQEGMGKDGYDAEELAASASDELKASLKDAGVDLEDVLSGYQTIYEASSGSAVASSDYSSLLQGSGSSRLYSTITTLLNRQFDIED